MPSPDDSDEGEAKDTVLTEAFQKLELHVGLDEYELALQAAVQANRLKFNLMNANSLFGREDSDNSSVLNLCIVSGVVCPDGDIPGVVAGTLRMTTIAESQVNMATFRDDILWKLPGQEALAYWLLSSDGKFRSDIWGHSSPNQGTGVWGSELGRGLLVSIDHIHVNDSLRGMGIGTKLFNQALGWVTKKACKLGQPAESCSYLVVEPGALRQDIIDEFGVPEGSYFTWTSFTGDYGEREAEVQAYRKQLKEKAKEFWRKQGFRRVGLSGFWAYATEQNHPSRQLTAEEDSKFDDIKPFYLA